MTEIILYGSSEIEDAEPIPFDYDPDMEDAK